MTKKADLFLGVPVSMDDDPTTGGNILHVKVVGDSGGGVYDEDVGALIVVSSEHHEVHEGEMFTAHFVSGSVSNGNSIDLLFSTTGSAQAAHFSWVASSGGDGYVYLYENITGSAGVNFDPVNVNRTSSKIAASVVRTGPTVGHVGTLKHHVFVPGGSGGTTPGGLARANTEWVLSPGRVYLIRVTNMAGTSQTMGLAIQWYEH